MRKDNIKNVLDIATQLVLSRDGDVDTEDGSFATVDLDLIIQLDEAVANLFDLKSDDVNDSDVPNIANQLGNY